MKRRAFLRVGGFGVAGLSLGLAPAARAAGPSIAGGVDSEVRVEFARFWEDAPIDAARLRSGERELAREGVRLTVYGLESKRETASDEEDVALDVLFPPAIAGGPALLFHPWSHSASRPCDTSEACSFVVPVGAGGCLSLRAWWGGRSVPIELATDATPHVPKLRTGLYRISRVDSAPIVLAVDTPTFEIESSPAWRNRDG